MSLFSIVYVSSARPGLRRPDLEAIASGAREFNGSRGITGMLLHDDGSFMQALEGEESLLLDLYTRIRNDRRHGGVITLLAEPLAEREFAGFAMAFENLHIPHHPALSLFNAMREQAGMLGRSYALLQSFRDRVLGG